VLRCKLAPLPPFQGREIGNLDHETRLVLPVCVTPFVERQKNDAEAIAGAALRPTMRYVSVKSAAQQAQAAGIVFRTRNLFVRQRSQLVNALRGHLAEYGVVVAQGRVQFRRLMVNFDETAPDLPEPDLPAPVQGLRWFMNCAACTLSRYSFLMKRSGVSIKRYNTGQRQMRAHRVS
jgi:transposase